MLRTGRKKPLRILALILVVALFLGLKPEVFVFNAEAGTENVNVPEFGAITIETGEGLQYDGNPKTICSITGENIDWSTDELYYKLDSATTWEVATGNSVSLTEAGTGTLSLGMSRNGGNIEEIKTGLSYSIAKAEFDVSKVSVDFDTLTYNGSEQSANIEVTYEEEELAVSYCDTASGLFSGTEPVFKDADSYDVYFKISSNNYNERVVGPYQITVNKKNLEAPTVVVYDYPYDGKEHQAVTVSAINVDTDTVTYTVGGNASTEAPKIGADVETKEIKVTVHRDDNHNDFVDTYTAKVTEADIKGINVTACSVTYDGNAHKAFNVTGTDSGDKIYYSVGEGTTDWLPIENEGNYPKVTAAGTTIYEIKVVRDTNYKDYTKTVTAVVNKEEQQLNFADVPGNGKVIYNANNTFTYVAASNKADATDGVITYSVVAEDTTATGVSCNATTGEVTYGSTGTIKIKAEIKGCANYEDTSKTYTIDVVYATAPALTIAPAPCEYKPDATTWYNANVTISATGWKIVKLAATEKMDISVLNAKTWNDSITETEEKAYEYQVVLKNTATGEFTDKISVNRFAIDKTAPVLVENDAENGKYGVKFVEKNTGWFSRVINTITFGLFCRESIEIEVTADDGNGAGIKEIQLKRSENGTGQGVECTRKEGTTNTFVVNPDFVGTFGVTLTDNVGNTREIHVSEENSNIASDYIMLEDTKPDILGLLSTATNGAVAYTDKDNNKYYNGDIHFSFAVQDTESGINSVTTTVNDIEVADCTKSFSPENTDSEKAVVDKQNYSFNLSDVSNNGNAVQPVNGVYTVKVKVVDNAGNSSEKTLTVRKDTTASVIKSFEFKGNVAEAVSVENYGFYFQQSVELIIAASDTLEDTHSQNEVPSGVKEITYRIVDNNGVEKKNTVAVNNENKISVIIPEGFKGQIYAYATDNLGQSGTELHPNGSIIETQAAHDQLPHIAFDVEKAPYTKLDGGSLYSGNVPVTMTVKDTFNGVSKIEWSVDGKFDPDNNQSGSLTVDNDGNTAGDSGWTKTATDKNLATEFKKTIVVSNNSNDILVWVKMTDRAGNISTQAISFSIDKTAPIISVVYDNNTPDSINNTIYKENRTATITITERNFNPADVVYAITNTDGVIPTLTNWTSYPNSEKPDASYHVAQVTYAADGDYTFDFSYSDMAANAGNAIGQHAFTIDKTLPVVSVAYDNNSAMNGNYYKADRTATITITEHNFDPSRVEVIGTVSEVVSATSFPTISNWTTVGDVHKATITYSADGHYSFDFDFKDMAGNNIADYAVEEFIVDKTMPTIVMPSAIANYEAHKEEIIAPVVSCNDTNYAKDKVTVTLTRLNDPTATFNLTQKDTAEGVIKGETFTYANLKNDDIYTLNASAVDMAGNETTETLMFAVNREGSVYDLTKLNHIIGKYMKANEDLVFTEENVDPIDITKVKIKLIKNGTPIDLVYGTDFTIEEIHEEGKWYQYIYTIKKSAFQEDGNYTIQIYSEDACGNVNENIEESKTAEISFGVDNTAPVIVPINLNDGDRYDVDTYEAQVEVKDNFVLEDVTIYLNDKEVEYEVNKVSGADEETEVDGDVYSFNIPEQATRQNVKIVAVDAAGNEYELTIKDILVTTDIFIQWYSNTPLFIGSIAGVAIVIIGVVAFVLFGKKKKEKRR